ncbi:hypothetical protein B9Z19DRAFT_1130579 [Tuber borchii]|uniref:Swiss Army Knife protein DSP-PTPase phosphatase domain-containing protein n=1 Tax=Tuber borchii TaxID=42251 RepID=A0A2T6ZK66_TUBBO|nr:hypothetical protein B9Z19DRAFT_1130579 [Tuber borchii]
MFTAVGEGFCLQEYQEGHHDQMWICEKDSDYQIGMRNRYTGRFLGTQGAGRFECIAPHNPKRRPLQRVDSDSPHLKVGEVATQFSLHRINNPVFRRFEWVIPGRLARSSAPYYDGEDADESINETSIEFLNNYGIKNIISLNSVELSPRQRGWLRAVGISYTHIKALEGIAVTQEQFDRIWSAYSRAGVTIVYCGYGDERTGIAISAIQLFQGRALDDNDYMENGVQRPSQLVALNALSDRIKGIESDSSPVDTVDTKSPSCTAPEEKERPHRMHCDEIMQGGRSGRK